MSKNNLLPNDGVLKDLSFSIAESFLQLIIFAHLFLHKEVIDVIKFVWAMPLIVHDHVKNAIKYMVSAPDRFGSGFSILFDMTTLVFYAVLRSVA